MNEKALGTYCGLLQEVKYRTEAIDAVLHKQLPLRGKIAEELCYLQLRMICELIAIGCLVLHGELKPKAELFKTYKADWIINSLSKLHPKFFPVALEIEDKAGSDPPEWVHRTSGFLTQRELCELWSRHAGTHLHRGSVKNVLASERPINFAEVQRWRDKVVNLLTRHIVRSADEQHNCYFVMSAIGSGEVHSALFQRVRGV